MVPIEGVVVVVTNITVDGLEVTCVSQNEPVKPLKHEQIALLPFII